MYDAFRLLYRPGDPAGDKEVIITGFSRGAAEARAFANRICDEAIERGEDVPQIQFMGLFDTVRMAASLEQAISPNVGYVAHATARNENRRAFPLTELFLRDWQSGVTCVTREFYGTHSDIGGGLKDNWISNAVLLWMWAQMRKAGVITVGRPPASVTAGRFPALRAVRADRVPMARVPGRERTWLQPTDSLVQFIDLVALVPRPDASAARARDHIRMRRNAG